MKESFNSENFLPCLKIKMTKWHQPATIVDSSFKIFDSSEFVQNFQHQLICAFLRYIVDKHFLPYFVLWTDLFKSKYLLGTPKGLTVIFPLPVSIGVMVTGSRTFIKQKITHSWIKRVAVREHLLYLGISLLL